MPEETNETISAAKLAANRENAQKSTGPTSEAGKAVSCMNAVKCVYERRQMRTH